MAKHFVSIVGRRMEAVIEVDADSEEDAIRKAAAKAPTLTECNWYMADEIEAHRVERIYSPADHPIKAW